MSYPLIFFLSINALFFSWIGVFHSLVPFSVFEYRFNANHYIKDPRIDGQQFSLMNALGQYDSQWYLRIADKGYPNRPTVAIRAPLKTMDTLLYNFFPLLPIAIATVNIFVHNIQLSAFILSNLILLSITYSLYFVVSRWFSIQVARKTILIILLFPFSVFLRGYYSEGLRLLLFIWFCYGLTQKNYFLSAICVGLACVTNGISLLLIPYYYGVLMINRRRIAFSKIWLYAALAIGPFIAWIIFCFIYTGNPFIFLATHEAWRQPPIFPLIYNFALIFYFPLLPSISVYNSQMDVLIMVITLALIFFSKNYLPKIVWGATVVLSLSPLLVQDTVSFARFSVVLFPFFVYLAVFLKKKYYIFLVCIFCLGLMISSLYFINWYWIE